MNLLFKIFIKSWKGLVSNSDKIKKKVPREGCARVRLASCKNALTPSSPRTPRPPPPVVYSTDRSKAVVPVLVLLFVALWFILRGDLFYVLSCVSLILCFQSS